MVAGAACRQHLGAVSFPFGKPKPKPQPDGLVIGALGGFRLQGLPAQASTSKY
jgi:hypothetical protein